MGLRGDSHPNAKLTSRQVREIRKLYSEGFSVKLLAKNYKVSPWNIENIVNEKTWVHLL